VEHCFPESQQQKKQTPKPRLTEVTEKSLLQINPELSRRPKSMNSHCRRPVCVAKHCFGHSKQKGKMQDGALGSSYQFRKTALK